MIKQLRQYILNKKKIEGSKIKQILGSDATLKEFADFWERHGDTLMMVTAIKLHDFTHEESFDKTDLEHYRGGLAEMGVFFADCSRVIEIEAQMKKEKEN